MRSQSKHHFPQLNLPLLDATPTVLPSDRCEELVEALVELLLAAAGHPDRTEGGQDEPEADL